MAWATAGDLPQDAQPMYSLTEWDQFLEEATDILWRATGRRWRGAAGSETVTWQTPTSYGWCGGVPLPGWLPPASLGYPDRAEPASVRLPRRDVTAVTSVLIDGSPLASGWELDGSWLRRTDTGRWPLTGERLVVTYTFGHSPPAGATTACATLATELARFVSPNPDQPGQLPRRLRSESHSSASAKQPDYPDLLKKGLTGLYTVDAWIRSVNPMGVSQQATVWSPDLPMAHRKG